MLDASQGLALRLLRVVGEEKRTEAKTGANPLRRLFSRWLGPLATGATGDAFRRPILGKVAKASPLLTFLASLLYATADRADGPAWAPTLTAAMMAGAAAFIAGALVGFLFGFPKTNTTATSTGALVAQNSNLDEISDWLTKILVGLGLVQIGELTRRFGELSDSLADGLGGGDTAKSFAVGLLLYSLIDGFILSYIWARVEVTLGLNRTAQDLRDVADVLADPLKPVPELPVDKPPGVGGGTESVRAKEQQTRVPSVDPVDPEVKETE